MFITRLHIKTEEIILHSKHASSACWDYKKLSIMNENINGKNIISKSLSLLISLF